MNRDYLSYQTVIENRYEITMNFKVYRLITALSAMINITAFSCLTK